MAVKNLLKGRSIWKTVEFYRDDTDELGNEIEVPIPHSEIEGVRVIMKNRGKELFKWSTLSADHDEGWRELSVEEAEGEYSFGLNSEETAADSFPVGLLKVEIARTYVHQDLNSFIKVSEFTIYNVISSLYQNEA
jgi:hypothetical protein